MRRPIRGNARVKDSEWCARVNSVLGNTVGREFHFFTLLRFMIENTSETF